MKILIVGEGAREHALAWKCVQSDLVDVVFVAPGNGGIATEPKTQNINIVPTATEHLVKFAREHSIDLTIIGPEEPLTTGIVKAFQDVGLRCFGPSKLCSTLEKSKIYTKTLLNCLKIPTARHKVCYDYYHAAEYIKTLIPPFVIKPDGLTGGKGVVVAYSVEEGLEAAGAMMVEHIYGKAGDSILVEEFIPGKEVSFIAVIDGHNIVPLTMVQDHKPIGAGNVGPMTGGMGAISPVLFFNSDLLQQAIMDTVMIPLVRHLEERGMPYVGFLFLGLKICAGVSYVLEINVRMGDPEGQAIMLRLESDLIEMLIKALDGDLANYQPQWNDRSVVGISVVSQGYPGNYETNKIITGLDVSFDNTKIFHSGTIKGQDGIIRTNGGRVLTVCGIGDTITDARNIAYWRINTIDFENMHYRKDIALTAV
ncbi:MAG: phosphoribosylamine--glycine ligase [Nitrosopumilaceae archaeon]